MSKPKAPTLKQAKAATTKLHSMIVRARNPHCEAVGVLPGECGGPLQHAHIVPKERNTQVAADPCNGLTLCAGHHIAIDTQPVYWLRMVQATVGVAIVFEWQRDADRAHREGLWVGGFGTGRPYVEVSPLKFWRHHLRMLAAVAEASRMSLDPLPNYIIDWLRTQQ